jgi:hypothetical protein
VWRSRDYGYPSCEHRSYIFKAGSLLMALYPVLNAIF